MIIFKETHKFLLKTAFSSLKIFKILIFLE